MSVSDRGWKMASAPADAPIARSSPSSSPATGPSAAPSPRFSNLRSVRWRVNLGILPSYPDVSVEDNRRVAANSQRRYASLRCCLLIDPHMYKDGDRSPGPVMDNPLSQSPDSMWGPFFQNAELEIMGDQDLSRLYPEHGSYFQTAACQTMLRRILSLWCLRHPEYGYRQGPRDCLPARAVWAGSLENSKNGVAVGEGQVTAVSGLKELRRISNLLSEM